MTHLSDSHTQPIIDTLDQARQQTGWSRSRMFSTWMDVVLATLQRDDDTYHTHVETIERDADPEPVLTAVARAFSNLLHQTATTNADVLGTVYERYGLTSDASGQFFTPPNVAAALAELQALTLDPTRTATPDDPLRIADPACGSGRLLLAMGRYLAREASDTPTLFVGQDSDPRCARMTAINLALTGCSGYITHGNSLTAEATATWKIDQTRGVDTGLIQEVDPIVFTGSTDPSEPSDTTTDQTQQQPATTTNQITLSAFESSANKE